ncbi:hypothetical protein L083_7427 [Actinoplanes sp. N902-109]|nr:hypothetical protein L083_7427 [Actinoplanes sp. N902-109]
MAGVHPQRARVGDPRLPHHQNGAAWFRLRCPAGCASAPANGQAEAARLVREHPAVCPNPGRVIRKSTVYPLVYADRIAR